MRADKPHKKQCFLAIKTFSRRFTVIEQPEKTVRRQKDQLQQQQQQQEIILFFSFSLNVWVRKSESATNTLTPIQVFTPTTNKFKSTKIYLSRWGAEQWKRTKQKQKNHQQTNTHTNNRWIAHAFFPLVNTIYSLFVWNRYRTPSRQCRSRELFIVLSFAAISSVNIWFVLLLPVTQFIPDIFRRIDPIGFNIW